MFFEKYQEAIFPIQIMSLGIIPMTVSAILEAMFIGKAKTKVAIISTAIQVGLYFSLILILGNMYGIIGLAISFVISAGIRAMFLVLAAKSFRFQSEEE